MDQTPLPFTFADGHTYADKGSKSVWVRGGQSGLEKRQCTVQLTIFADGEPRIKPFLIFKGQGYISFVYIHCMLWPGHYNLTIVCVFFSCRKADIID